MFGKRVKSIVLICAVAIAAMALASGCAQETGGIAARYDGGEVTEAEVEAYTADFRSSRSLEDNHAWAEYLAGEGLTARTWRERAIGSIVESKIIRAKADELGIAPDEVRVSAQIASDKENAGIDGGDDEAWARYLESLGKDELSYRADLESASVEQQLLSQMVELDPSADAEAVSAYIDENLRTRVVRRYRALCFDAKDSAQAAIDDMAGLSGDSLVRRFAEWLDRDDSDATTSEGGGDAGWDIANNLGPAQNELNQEMVPEGELSAAIHEIDGAYYVFLCSKRFEFGDGVTYEDLPDDALKRYVLTAATYDKWTELTNAYISGLLDQANVQVSSPPSNAPYNVDGMIG